MGIFQKKAINPYLCKTTFFLTGCTILIIFFFAACSGRINGKLQRDGSAEFSLEINLEPRMSALIRSLSSLAGAGQAAVNNQAALLINGPVIARSMAAAPGIESVSLVNRSPSSITGNIRVFRIDEFFSLPALSAGGKRFITYAPGEPPGDSRLLIALDRDIAPLLLAMISEDIRDYLSALMAPAATGEQLSRTEYLELVDSFYGKALADEIAAARITVSIGFPGPVGSVKGGVFTGTQARFDLSLVELLVLENPLEYEVIWR
jgi:hypothetical protein